MRQRRSYFLFGLTNRVMPQITHFETHGQSSLHPWFPWLFWSIQMFGFLHLRLEMAQMPCKLCPSYCSISDHLLEQESRLWLLLGLCVIDDRFRSCRTWNDIHHWPRKWHCTPSLHPFGQPSSFMSIYSHVPANGTVPLNGTEPFLGSFELRIPPHHLYVLMCE